MPSNLKLYRATFKANWPVCTAYILYYLPGGMNAPIDPDAQIKAIATGLGFSYPDPLEIQLLGKIQPTKDYPNGVLAYETGEY